MGLFDFLKPKKRQHPLDFLGKDPAIRRTILAAKLEFVQKQIANLKAVGRAQEARKAGGDYLQEVLQEWKHEPQNPSNLTLFTNVAISLGELEAAKETLKAVIESTGKTPFIDLTVVYMDLGRIYHQLRNAEKELWCYHKATDASPPPNCKFPATKRDKAKAHNFAYMSAMRLHNQEHIEYHDFKRRELSPDVDWDDPMKVIKWIQEG